jgi:hypothetical protein
MGGSVWMLGIARQLRIQVHAYCLMSNHFFLVLESR